MEYQVLVYGIEGDILSSQHYDEEPTQKLVDELISEDDGVKALVYEVDGDFYSKLLTTYEI